jgi:hypothetical protein
VRAPGTQRRLDVEAVAIVLDDKDHIPVPGFQDHARAGPRRRVWRCWSAPATRSGRGSSPPSTAPRLEAAAVEIGLDPGPLQPLVQAVLERPGQADDSPATRLPAQVESIDAEAAAAGRAVVWWRTLPDRVVRVPGRDLERGCGMTGRILMRHRRLRWGGAVHRILPTNRNDDRDILPHQDLLLFSDK